MDETQRMEIWQEANLRLRERNRQEFEDIYDNLEREVKKHRGIIR